MDQPIKIVIRRQNQKYGPYSSEEARSYLSTGQLLRTDTASFEGAEEWTSLATILGMATEPSPPPPFPPFVQPGKPVWFRQAWFHVPLFLIVPYVQVPLMWIVKAFSLRTRIIVTALGCLFVVILISLAGGKIQAGAPQEPPKDVLDAAVHDLAKMAAPSPYTVTNHYTRHIQDETFRVYEFEFSSPVYILRSGEYWPTKTMPVGFVKRGNSWYWRQWNDNE